MAERIDGEKVRERVLKIPPSEWSAPERWTYSTSRFCATTGELAFQLSHCQVFGSYEIDIDGPDSFHDHFIYHDLALGKLFSAIYSRFMAIEKEENAKKDEEIRRKVEADQKQRDATVLRINKLLD